MMQRKIFAILLACQIGMTSIIHAEERAPQSNSTPHSGRIVGGIALFVNGEPITLHAIERAQIALNTDRVRATDALVMEKLKDYEIKRLKIDINDAQMEAQITQIAQQNNMNLEQFYAAIMREGMSLSEYKSKLKEQMLTQELMRKILFSSNVGQEDELRKYYNEHSEEFIIPKEVQGIKFVSNDKGVLESFMRRGISSTLPEGIAKQEETIQIDSLPPQVADIFLMTSERSFTQIFESDGGYIAFYLEKKLNSESVEFEKAKNYIAQKLIANNQEKILQDYFERVRSRSKIVFVR